MTAFADVDDLGLFTEAEAHSYPPLSFVGVCDVCGAKTAPIPHENLAGERLDPGDRWTGVHWAILAIAAHKPNCPGPPHATPGIHLRPLNPNYAPEGAPSCSTP